MNDTKYKLELSKISKNDDLYLLRVYELESNDFVMSMTDYLDNIYNEATYWVNL